MNHSRKKRSLHLSFLIFVILFTQNFSAALAQENTQIFQPEPSAQEKDEGRAALQCARQMGRFFSAPRSDVYSVVEEFRDYFRDFFLWPAHFRDVVNIEAQVHKAFQEVIEAFVRCDPERLKSTIGAYWRLSAELYYVRHYVDTATGRLQILPRSPITREQFRDRMTKSFFGSMPGDAEKEKLLFEGYFDMFEAKYKDRAKSYGQLADDPEYERLKKKVTQLVETITSLKEFVNEPQMFFQETAADLQSAVPSQIREGQIVSTWQNKGKTLESLTKNVISRFKICPEGGDQDACKNLIDIGSGIYGKKDDAVKILQQTLGLSKPVENFTERKTVEEVQNAVAESEQKRNALETKAEMLSRYETLYGQIEGDGLASVLQRMDALVTILGPSVTGGSIPPLVKTQQCAEKVREQECR
ncbi:hypothetical protein HYV58_01370 [Candidatus Peregrinibacteria bacterium]|nr:hypothetical protein [Candidatus Peregrinibacteria bacterium]